MRSKKLRTFLVNEKEMLFNVRLFQELFIKHANKRNVCRIFYMNKYL